MLERDEWKAFSDVMALAASAFCTLVGLILAIAGKDPAMAFHGCILLGAAGLAFLYILTQIIEKKEPHDASRLCRRRDPRRRDRHRVLGRGRLSRRRHHRLAARLSRRSISICPGPASAACGRCTPPPSSSPSAAMR